MAKYSEGGGDGQKFLSSLFEVLKRKDEGSLDPNLQKILQTEADEARDKPPIWFLQSQLDAQRRKEQTTGGEQVGQKEEAPTETPEPASRLDLAREFKKILEEKIAGIEAEIRTGSNFLTRLELRWELNSRLADLKKKLKKTEGVIKKLSQSEK